MARTKFIDLVRGQGLRRYLMATTKEHNGVGWAFFQTMMRVGTPPYQVCNIMNMSRRQVDDLITVYNEQYKK